MPSQMKETFDFIADQFRDTGKTALSVEFMAEIAERQGYAGIWEIPHGALANAMKMRGLEVKAGQIKYPDQEGDHFDPVQTDYAEFLDAAKMVIGEAEYPLPTDELIERTGLHASSAPLTSMQYRLRQVGIHFLPGVGYWRHPQYTDPSGRTVSRRIRSERIEAMVKCFEEHGWPIEGGSASEWTDGLVTSRFLSRHAAHAEASRVTGIGSGLYIPADKAETSKLPMSRNVAQALLDVGPDTVLDDKDNLRLFRIMLVAARLGWVRVRKSRTTRDRIRRQTMRVTWTDEGRKNVEKILTTTSDEF